MNIKSIFVSSIIAFYPSVILFLKSPWFDTSGWASKLVFFIVIFVLVYLAISRVTYAEKSYSIIKHLFEIVVLGIGVLSALVALLEYILPTKGISVVGLATKAGLPLGYLFFTLLIIPLASLLVAIRR
ncbi:MAG: hypothetical protein PHF79_03495 [Candidatus Pacebacteria bacterium]|nr:hypothetical protein [Candidatus Paceibacterota bacterium]